MNDDDLYISSVCALVDIGRDVLAQEANHMLELRNKDTGALKSHGSLIIR